MGTILGGPHDKDYNVLGICFGIPLFLETTESRNPKPQGLQGAFGGDAYLEPSAQGPALGLGIPLGQVAVPPKTSQKVQSSPRP